MGERIDLARFGAMEKIMNYPLLLACVSMVCMWASARVGAYLCQKRVKSKEELTEGEYGIVLSATLTLLGLLIGFSFSMAIGRYDQRKDFEEEEANAIGTEYIRADLLPDPIRSQVKRQLAQYLDLRIRRYEAHASDD